MPTDIELEPATGTALQEFIRYQSVAYGTPALISLLVEPGYRIVGDREPALALMRAVIAQLVFHHGADHLRLVVVSADTAEWDWVKWLPHAGDPAVEDAAGPVRMVYSTVADFAAVQFDAVLKGRDAFRARHAAVHDPIRPLPHTVIINDVDDDGGPAARGSGKASARLAAVRNDVDDDGGPVARSVGKTSAKLVDRSDDDDLLDPRQPSSDRTPTSTASRASTKSAKLSAIKAPSRDASIAGCIRLAVIVSTRESFLASKLDEDSDDSDYIPSLHNSSDTTSSSSEEEEKIRTRKVSKAPAAGAPKNKLTKKSRQQQHEKPTSAKTKETSNVRIKKGGGEVVIPKKVVTQQPQADGSIMMAKSSSSAAAAATAASDGTSKPHTKGL
jgi:DNA segregation ATPase FtsK/SpoIIIE-like protein